MKKIILTIFAILISINLFAMSVNTTPQKISAPDRTFLQNTSSNRMLIFVTPLASTTPDTSLPGISIEPYQTFLVVPSENNYFIRTTSGEGYIVKTDGVTKPDISIPAVEVIMTEVVDELQIQTASLSEDLSAIDESVNSVGASLSLKIDELISTSASETVIVSAINSLESAINPASIATQTITITGAAPSVQITSGVSTRRYISVSSQNINQNIAIWINFGGTAAQGVGELVYTGASYPFDETVDVWVYSDATVDIYVIEGGSL